MKGLAPFKTINLLGDFLVKINYYKTKGKDKYTSLSLKIDSMIRLNKIPKL